MQDFEGEVAELFAFLGRSLDVFARVGIEELKPQSGADGADEGSLFWFVDDVAVRSGASEGGKVADERVEFLVVGVGFKAEAILERDGKGVDEVQSGHFGE